MHLKLAISTNATVTALCGAIRQISQQMDGLILASAIAAEKFAALETVNGLQGYQEMSKKVVSRIMAAEHLRSGRAIAGVPFRTNADVMKVLTVRRSVQKLSTVLLAHCAWEKSSWIYLIRNLLLHPTYCATHYWGTTDKYYLIPMQTFHD